MVLKIQKYDMNIKFEITKTFNEESILDKNKNNKTAISA